MPHKTILLVAALIGFLGVAAGAFGSHALKERLSASMLEVFQVAVRYQIYHVLAACVAAIAFGLFANSWFLCAGWFFLIGSIFFSGSLYLYVATGLRNWGMITPIGGVLFLLGWLSLAIGAWRA